MRRGFVRSLWPFLLHRRRRSEPTRFAMPRGCLGRLQIPCLACRPSNIVISENLPRCTGLAASAGPKVFECSGIWASIVISENLSRRTGLAANAGAKGFEWRGIWASIMISVNLPRRTGLSADAGPGSNSEWTPAGRGWEAEARELGGRSWEAGGRRDPHV